MERRLAPLSAADVEALLARPRIGRVLSGWRGEPPLDRPALEKMVRAVGAAALAHPELAELEVNPALVLPLGEGAFAVDVRARLSPAEVVT